MTEDKSQWLRRIWKQYLAGTASREELMQLQEYLQQEQRPELDLLFREQQEGEEVMPVDMAGHMRLLLTEASTPPPTVRKLNRRAAWWSAAAIFLLAVAGSYALLRNHRQEAATALSAIAYDSVVNNASLARFVQLPDATNVWLNRGAKLYISKNYSRQRRVRLIGEAYFDVVKNAAEPLVVATGGIHTTVLGTGFNVDNSGGKVNISLVQGKVQVSNADLTGVPVLLAPGETALADERSQSITHDRTAVTDVAGWIKGHLVLNQLPLSDALAKAGAYYGVIIRADHALVKDKMVNTVYYKHQEWQQVLHHLLFMYRLTYTINAQQEIVITPQ